MGKEVDLAKNIFCYQEIQFLGRLEGLRLRDCIT